MHLRRSFQFTIFFIAALVSTLVVAAQTKPLRAKQKKYDRLANRQINLTPDGRSRKMPGSSEGAEGRSTASTFRSVNQKDEHDRRPKDPTLSKLKKAAGSYDGDLRDLPAEVPLKRERPEREGPEPNPQTAVPPKGAETDQVEQPFSVNSLLVPAPAPASSFDGLDFATWGAGHPPDTNGDVGPNYFIQTVNTSIGIYNKATGSRVAAFTFNTFMSQGQFGNLCDTNNFGDPVVLYDTFEDRWVITDFAFKLDGSGNVINPPGSFECFAVSKNGDPLNGGWNFYSINATGGLGDYPKLGVWPDGIYMSVNMFGYPAGAAYQGFRVYALNKSQMYAGSPTVQVLSFDGTPADFTVLPSNARLQTGTPPPGRPNLFVSTEQFLNGLSVYKFHVDWDRPLLSTFTGPDTQLAPNCWPNATPANAATTGNAADVLSIRAMVQNQYSNIGGAESLWLGHTVQRGVSANNTTCNATTGGNATARWYQLNVTGGTVAANVVQGSTFDPDGANTFFRFMPSVAVNKMGDMALGYTKSNATTNPQLKYAGRLAGDPANSITQTEQTLIDGTGSQSGACGSGPCTRWGDYSAMTLDPDGCTFWYTSEYYATSGLNDLTRIGSFAYPLCTSFINNGGLQGTVKSAITNQPLQGAVVSLGSRSATTDSAGHYAFSGLPQGSYQSASAALGGYQTATAVNISVTDGNVATQDFSLSAAGDSNCFTDSTQSDFQTGSLNNTDVTVSPDNVVLNNSDTLDQQNSTVSPTGFAFTSTSWAGQTFTPAVSGQLKRIDIELFCAGCSGANPNITVSIRATSGATPVPTGADLASTTLAGFNDGGTGGLKTVTFSTPATVTAGTRYALLFRSATTRATGSYAYTCSCATTGYSNSNPYSSGQLVTSSNSGAAWSADTTTGGRDLNFRVYVNQGYRTSGDFVSGLKDSNPAAPNTTTWGAISWMATVPANTTLKFQAAASNGQFGPFNFVGPDGTASTFFTNGDSLAEFNGLRYLKYKVLFATTDGTVTPTLNDVTVCNTNPRVWTGAVDSNWNNAGNWSSSGVPGSTDPAIIPSTGVLNNPAAGINVSVGSVDLGQGRIIDMGANSLTVTNCSTSAIAGGSVNSYIKGKLIRCINGPGPYTFPVGTAAGYAPVTLDGMVGSGTFTVNPVDAVLTGTDPAKTLKRYWDLSPAGGVTQANITLNYQDADVPAGADESAFKFIRRNSSGDLAIDPTASNAVTNTFTLSGVTAFSSWTVGTLLGTTAADVSVSGRVLRRSGVGVSNAIVSIVDERGTPRSVRTNSFGYYTIDGVRAGSTYVINVQAKGYTFPPRAVTVGDTVANLDFIAGTDQ